MYLLTHEEMWLLQYPNSQREECVFYTNTDLWDPPAIENEGEKTPVLYAIDCEMVETRHGLEIGRVSLVDEDFNCVYDELVLPENPVTDYLTQ